MLVGGRNRSVRGGGQRETGQEGDGLGETGQEGCGGTKCSKRSGGLW